MVPMGQPRRSDAFVTALTRDFLLQANTVRACFCCTIKHNRQCSEEAERGKERSGSSLPTSGVGEIVKECKRSATGYIEASERCRIQRREAELSMARIHK